ncbi:MAG: hydrogenase expression/formation protein [Rhodoferax sp.]|nr:hydrogenase expression/formation protein [Rhodoferax sp.]MDD2882301.1 hydrogenase expression/formation protein [Rhodoferax sp.]
MKPFPIPVVADLGPGTQSEDDTLDYIAMPQGMETYHTPVLPEPEEIAQHAGAVLVLHEVLSTLRQVAEGAAPKHDTARVTLARLGAQDLTLINQVLGEGEVSAQVLAQDGTPVLQIQEAVFAGVWRVIESAPDGTVRDWIEVGGVPEVLRQTAKLDGGQAETAPLAVPPEVMNAPSVLVELEDQRRTWQPGQVAHVVNLSLLPLTPIDIGYLDHRLGTGRVLILSRGYGNCRITNCCVPHTWRVVYYNSQDTVILNSVEVTDMPDVVCAAPEDLCDSVDRLHEVLQWVNQS